MKKVPIIACVVFLAICIFLLLPFGKTTAFNANEYQYDLNYSIELSDFPIMTQKTDHTCYVVSMAIVRNYLGDKTTESDLLNELGLQSRTTGMLPSEYISCANEAFSPLSYKVSLVNPSSQTQILTIVTDSLENGLPVIIFYSAPDYWHETDYNTHYGVIYGIDMEGERVLLSNPFGYSEELSFSELYSGLDFSRYPSEPFAFQLGRKFGVIQRNNLFIIEKITE